MLVVECHGMSWNVMECHGMSWNVMECHGMSWNAMTHCPSCVSKANVESNSSKSSCASPIDVDTSQVEQEPSTAGLRCQGAHERIEQKDWMKGLDLQFNHSQLVSTGVYWFP